MQRLTPLLVGVVLTWLTPVLAQTPDYIIQSNSAPMKSLLSPAAPAASAPQPAQPKPQPAAPLNPPPSVAASAPQAKAPPRAALRIGVLLPAETTALGEAAAVVRSGVEAAAAADQNAQLVNVDATAQTVVAHYREAVASGVGVVIGPLSRAAIAELAPYVTVPTLALNSVGREAPYNPKLYSLSLTVEGEAKQLARLLRDDGRANPLVLASGDALSQRIRQAFSDEWRVLAGKAPQVLAVTADNLPVVVQAAGQTDAVVLAVESRDAAPLRAALSPDLPVYATSQLNNGNTPPELAGVRFIDMPWFLMPDHPAVKRYPRPTTPLTVQTERLYALGIDAYRLAVQLAALRQNGALKLDGVTGDLKLGRDRVFERQLPAGVMGGNRLQ
nr:penicillin-binding protein activator [Chromobacterium sp. ASV5]